MTTFERVVAYVARFDPAFPAAIRGAEPGLIAELDSRLGGNLPAIHRDFLTVMGRDMDWIQVGRMDFRIETVLDYYEEHDHPPSYFYVRIGTERAEPRFHPHLEIKLEGDHPVVCFPYALPEYFHGVVATHREYFAGSLHEMVCTPVFRIYELHGGGTRRPISLRADRWDPGALRPVEEVAARLGFETVWFSSATARALRRDDAAAWAVQRPGVPLQLTLAADSG
ncbi:MAG TPA: hypothetical protein VF590_16665, partial [Isosphaeraceae bacterium]